MQLEKGEPHRARGMPVFDEHVDATSECSVEQHVVDEVTDIDSRDDEGEPEVEDEDTRHLNTPVPKGILSETRRGAGTGASPWKQVKFQSTLPEGFPERLTQQSRGFTQRGGELGGLNLLFLVLICIFLARVLTTAVSTMLQEEL